jgi:DNA-binding MarR family transcriptional regulator
MQSTDPLAASLQEWIHIFMRRSMRNLMLFARENGLSVSQIMTLFRIQKGGGGVNDMADSLGISSAAASQMLERLVQQDLIVRSEDPHDRRAKQIVLSEKGQAVIQESLHVRQDWLGELACTLSASEKDQVVAALDLLIEKAKFLQEQTQ